MSRRDTTTSVLMSRTAIEEAANFSRNEARVLRPEVVSHRRLPVNFNENDRELFQHELERVIPATRLLELQDVSVSSDGFLFKRGKILPESFAFPWQLEEWKTRSLVKFFLANYFSKRRSRLESPAVLAVDNWSIGFFHWVADTLSRLFVVKDHLGDWVMLLPHQYQALDFVRPSLEPFGIRNIRFIDAEEVLFCKKLMVPSQTAPSGNYNEEIIKGVRDLMVGYYNPSGPPATKRIFISRSRAQKRNIVNEEEVIEILKEFEFEVFHTEDCTFEQQVKIASDARFLVSNHGAGLTNMLFMRSGRVLELRHHTDRVNNCYFTLASALGLDYFYQNCEPSIPNEDPHTAHLVVDTSILRENLSRLLAS